ncbi:MAG: P-II family nitrogen regulator [Deltaproteobacteria bacterium]|nr:P-II family nitrogen regulator [Deltaproteobacteria bacterium]
MNEEHFNEEKDLITCVVQRGKADKVAKAALDAGAGGATVFFGRGMGLRERLGLLGLAIVPEKEIILIVSEKTDTSRIFDAVIEAGKLNVPGMGIAYVSPIHAVVGLVPFGKGEKE